MSYNFNDAVFTYMLSENKISFFNNHNFFSHKNYVINYTENTTFLFSKNKSEEIGIIGFCIDSHGEISRKSVPNFLLENSNGNIETLCKLSSRMAGKFVIFYDNGKSIYMFSDATSSLQIYYDESKTCISSNYELIAKINEYEISDYSKKIRNSSSLTQALPYNITMYKEIKTLLPNYYLNVNNNETFHFTNNKHMKLSNSNISKKMILKKSITLSSNIAKEYNKHYDLLCPLTSGWDSRLNFAILLNNKIKFKSYTFQHSFSNSSSELTIPNKICEDYSIDYQIINDLKSPKGYNSMLRSFLGNYESNNTVDLAYTISSNFKGKAIINGAIIDQIGKSLIGRDLSCKFATPKFFQAKIHNYSPESLNEIKNHLETFELQNISHFDLFALENRCGRWAAQRDMIYSMCSVPTLNLYNCKKLIDYWMILSRERRSNKVIHKYIFKNTIPNLKKYPFNPDDKLGWLKNNELTFLLATYGKFWLNYFRFHLG